MTLSIVRVSAVGVDGGTTSPQTFNHGGSFGVGHGVVWVASYWNTESATQPIATVTIAGTAATRYTRRANADLGGGIGGDLAEIWMLGSVVNSGRTDVVITFTPGSPDGIFLTSAIIEVNAAFATGANASGDNAGTSTAPSATTSGSTSSTDLLVVANWANGTDGTSSASPPTGYTQAYVARTGGEGGAGAYKLDTASAGTRTATFASGSVNWVATIAAFAAFSGSLIDSDAGTDTPAVTDTLQWDLYSPADAVSTTDSITRSATFGRVLGDTAAISDSVPRNVEFGRVLGDTVSYTDSASAIKVTNNIVNVVIPNYTVVVFSN